MSNESYRSSTNAWAIMQPVRGQIWFSMLLAGGSAAAALGVAVALARAMQTLLLDSTQYPWWPLAMALLLTVVALVLRLAAFNQSHFAAFRLETVLRTQLATHLAEVSLGYVQKMGVGALSKVMMEDVKALHVFVADSSPLYARAYISPMLTFVLLFVLDWPLALAATAVLLIGVAAVALAWRGSDEMMRRYNEATESVGAAVVEYVQAMPVVRTFDSGTATFGRYQRALEAYRDVVTRWYKSAGTASRLSQIILSPLPTLAVLLWLGAWLVSKEQLDAATWIAVLLIGTGMAESLLPLMSLKHLVAKTQISIQRIQDVLAEPALPVVSDADSAFPVEASLRFENVSFSYGEGEAIVLDKVSFEAPQGSVTALVGASGAGKTTVARLILRFWDVTAGSIQIGGVDVRDMSHHVLMQQVAFVFQDTFLFAGSIAENIALGMPEASMDDIVAAAKAAQAHEFIMSLAQGYDTPTGERGTFLSGGQRQRITIARAILQNRPILVLDEATAFADPENEAALIAALANLMRGKTVVMVAHRLNTIRHADQILVFEQGRLLERGSHESLLAKQGAYANLWQHYEQAQHWAFTGGTR